MIREAIVDTFLELDSEFLVEANKRGLYCGSTAISVLMHQGDVDRGEEGTQTQRVNEVAVDTIGTSQDEEDSPSSSSSPEGKVETTPVGGTPPGQEPATFAPKGSLDVWIANLGDSSAVLCRNKQAIALSEPHTPMRESEAQRLKEANGWITEEKELFMGQLHRMDLEDPEISALVGEKVKWVTISRVCGELAVTRSLGDADFKDMLMKKKQDLFFAFPKDHSMTFTADLLTAEPEVRHITVEPGDDFLILASDGLWDVLSAQQAVDAVQILQKPVVETVPEWDDRPCELNKEHSLDDVAASLCSLALRLGSADNITVILVKFEF